MIDHPLHPTRRTLLSSGLLVGLAGCGSVEGLAQRTATPTPAGSTPASGTPAPGKSAPVSEPPTASTQPVLGVQRYDINDTLPGADQVLVGPRTALLIGSGEAVILSSVIEGARQAVIPETDDQTPPQYAGAVELSPEATPATAVLVFSRRTGSGLDASEDVLTCLFSPQDGSPPTQGEFVVPKPEATLNGAAVVEGVTVASISWELERADYTKYESILRVAFDAQGKVIWQRTDENTDRGNDTGIGRCLGLGEFIAVPGAVVFGVGLKLLTVDIKTGKTRGSVQRPWARGLQASEGSFYVLDAYGGGGELRGKYVYRRSDGTVLGQHASSVAIDAVKDTVAIGYSLTGEDPNRAPAVDSDPALVVVQASGKDLFNLPRAKGQPLGKVECVSAFDGRLVVLTEDNLRILRAEDGTADPDFENIPAGQYSAKSLPFKGGAYAQALGTCDRSGRSPYEDTIIVSGSPLTWQDLDVQVG